MRSKLPPFYVVLAVVTLMMMGCTSSLTTAPSSPGKGALYTLMTDTPACDVLGFRVEMSTLSLIRQGSTTTTTVFPPSVTVNPNFVSPQVEVTRLEDFTKILNLERIPAGTYDQAVVDLVMTNGATYDPSANPPVTTFSPTATTSSVTVNINPPVVITPGGVSAILLDLNLQKSLPANAEGQLTGTFTPLVAVTSLTPSASGGFGEMDDIDGFTESVTPVIATPGSSFTGSFTLQTFPPNGPALTVNLTNSTQLFGTPALNQLLTPSYVESDGYLDSQGNLVANSVQVESREDVNSNTVAYLGPVLTVTRGAGGNLSQFTMLVRDTQPDVSSSILPETPAIVSVSGSTTFQVAAPPANFAMLPFNPSNLAPGQEVAVSGPFTPNTSAAVTALQPVAVNADSVFLRLATLQGNFSGLIQAESDDKTGAFQLAVCSQVFQAEPTMVITDNTTNFVDVTGLTELTPQAELLVKGLAFYEPQATTINTISVPAGTLVVLAKQVHAL